MKSLLADSSGLRVASDKSLILPINVSDDKLELLANALDCLKDSLPFTYLGLPLSLTKLLWLTSGLLFQDVRDV